MEKEMVKARTVGHARRAILIIMGVTGTRTTIVVEIGAGEEQVVIVTGPPA